MTSSEKPIASQDRLRKFVSQVRSRNVREWIATAIVAVSFALLAGVSRGWLRRICAAEIAAAAMYVAWRLYRDGRIDVSPSELDDPESSRLALAREMKRQAALLGRAATWYVAPLGAGWIGLQLADAYQSGITFHLAIYAPIGIAVGVLIAYANHVAARKLLTQVATLQARPAQ